ncbi:MAG TPA: hypothetical protein PK109_02215 [Candidatus Paceibacterota bacterium]|nr:hypothetical protein [Candidatus Paceibacterota bacterium]
MEHEPTAEKLPSRVLGEMGFTCNFYDDPDVAPKSFDTVDRGDEVVVMAYDEKRVSWTLTSTESVETLETMMKEKGFTPNPSLLLPTEEDPIN